MNALFWLKVCLMEKDLSSFGFKCCVQLMVTQVNDTRIWRKADVK